jgi:hypothetical protein
VLGSSDRRTELAAAARDVVGPQLEAVRLPRRSRVPESRGRVEREILVSIDFDGAPVPVGRLRARVRIGRGSSSVEHQRGWLRRRGAFALGPELRLTAGLFHTERSLFNALTGPAPDPGGPRS